MADLSARIEAAASQAQSVETDGLKTNDRTLKDLIDADRYLAEKAARQVGSGLRFHRLINKSDYER